MPEEIEIMPSVDDVSTVISIVPVSIAEFKPGIYPGQFNIPACDDPNKPNLLRVRSSNQVFTVDGSKNPIAVKIPSFEIAAAIVRDYNTSQLGLGGDAAPGITFVQGKITVDDFITKHPKVLAELKRCQRIWFVNLVKIADDDWARYHSHKAISSIAKYGARALKIERDWLVDEFSENASTQCPACKERIDATAIVCRICRAIVNPKLAEQQGIKFAA